VTVFDVTWADLRSRRLQPRRGLRFTPPPMD